ncbi:MAG TPA: hypothetical protein VJ746_05530 [Nitrospira sp.]|nr:hypothetical protein [Nitrospira sp.]
MSDRDPQDDRELRAHAKRLLDQSVEDLDRTTTLRLQRVRVAALSAGVVPRWKLAWGGGLAVMAVIALAILFWTKQPAKENHHGPFLEDMELVISAENVELAQDLEFYHWLVDADQTG